MSKWEMVSFDDVISDETKNGFKIPKEAYLKNGTYPIIDQGKNYVAGYTDDKTGLYKDVPIIIFGDHTRIIKFIDFPLFLGADGVKLLKCRNKNLNSKFLYYFLKTVHIPDTGYNRHFKWLKEIIIPMPPYDTQLKMVEILDKINVIIEKRKMQIEKLNLLVKAHFVGMFGDPVTNPKRWELGTIRDIAHEVKYGTSKPANEKGKYPYLRMNNITYDGRLDLSDLKYIDIKDNELEKYIVRNGDVLFNRTNSKELVGKTCVFNIDKQMIIAGYIIRIRLNEKALPIYLSFVLNSDYGKLTLRAMCKTIIGQANINAQELQQIKIQIPPITLQNRFADFVKQIDKSSFVMQKGLEKLELTYKALMQQYFG